MKDRWLAVGILLVVAFALGRALYVPPGHETVNYDNVPLLTMERCNPPLLEVWEAMDKEIAFENETARFGMLVMSFDAEGTVTAMNFGFFADMQGESWVHSAYVLRNGSAYLSSQRLDYRPPHPHPLDVLTAVDSIPFGEIQYGERGMNLKIFEHKQNRTYDDTYGNIYALVNGTLRPLEEISFSTSKIWHTCAIYPIPEKRTIMLDGVQQNTNRTAITIDEDPRALIIFAPREIGLAKSVTYT